MRFVARILSRVFLLLATPLLAQQPGPDKDPRLLERPQPLCILNTSDVNAALAKVNAVVTAESFKVDSINWNDGELHASREEVNSTRSDRIVIWLEPDCRQPVPKISVYLLYGRWLKFVGEPGESRVVGNDALEKERIGSLKSKLIALSFPGGSE